MKSYHIKRADGTRWHAGNYMTDAEFLLAHPWANLASTLRLDVAEYPRAAKLNPNWG